ncbi:MAG: hypothetical protein Q9181_002202, partial [Wetmoreana brouardii]
MTQQVEALLTEHFRYTPLSLIDDIINTVNTIIYRAIEAIENGLFSIPPQQLGYSPDNDTSRDESTLPDANHPEAKDEIENGVHQLETLLEATVDKTFDKFEIYTLRNILTVPDELAPWMRLGHYEVRRPHQLLRPQSAYTKYARFIHCMLTETKGLTLPVPPTSPTPESVLALRRKVQETRKLNLLLRTTHARNAATISQLRSILSAPSPESELPSRLSAAVPATSLAFLTSHPSATQLAIAPFTAPALLDKNGERELLTEQTQFFISQLPALRQALVELKPRLRTLPEKIGDVDWESRREERRAYIEGE